MIPRIFKKMVAIDISPTHIKVLCLKHNPRRYDTTYYAEKSLLSCTTTEALQQALTGLSAGYAIIALPDDLINLQFIQVGQELTAQQLETEAAKAAQQYFPDLAEKMCVDYALLTTNVVKSKRDKRNTRRTEKHCAKQQTQTLLLAATHQDHLLARVNLIERVGLTVKVIDVASHAKLRAFLSLHAITCQPNRQYGLMTVGATHCELIVFNEHTVISVYEQLHNDALVTTTQQLVAQHATEHPLDALHALYLLGSKERINCNDIPLYIISAYKSQPFSDDPVGWLLCYGLALRGMQSWCN